MPISTNKDAEMINDAIRQLEILSTADIKDDIDDVADKYTAVIHSLAITHNKTFHPLIQQMTSTVDEMSKHLLNNKVFTQMQADKVRGLILQDVADLSHLVSEYNARESRQPSVSSSPHSEPRSRRHSFIGENKPRTDLNPNIPFEEIDMSKVKKSPK